MAYIKELDAFVCTEEDMTAGGCVLPKDKRLVHEASDEERKQIVIMFGAFTELKKLGWRESMYAPQDSSNFLAIEAGSTGIHECTRHKDGHFWVYDGDVWPSKPILWKPLAQGEEEG